MGLSFGLLDWRDWRNPPDLALLMRKKPVSLSSAFFHEKIILCYFNIIIVPAQPLL